MNYEGASEYFIQCAFNLLRWYKDGTHSFCVGNDTGCMLPKGYMLSIYDNGCLVLKKRYVDENGCFYNRTINHSFNKKYSQEVYIGKLLSAYLERLQLEEINDIG